MCGAGIPRLLPKAPNPHLRPAPPARHLRYQYVSSGLSTGTARCALSSSGFSKAHSDRTANIRSNSHSAGTKRASTRGASVSSSCSASNWQYMHGFAKLDGSTRSSAVSNIKAQHSCTSHRRDRTSADRMEGYRREVYHVATLTSISDPNHLAASECDAMLYYGDRVVHTVS